MSGCARVPKLGKSTDGGATWQLRDLTAALGAGVRSFSLIAVDPVNAARVYLRVADANGERLAITDDGGATATSPLMLAGRRDDGVRARAVGRDAAHRQGRARPGDVPLDGRRGDVSDAAGAADAAGHGRARQPDLRRVGHAGRDQRRVRVVRSGTELATAC